jgi:hypothetical protein
VPEGTHNFTYTLGNGENFLTIVASAGEAIQSVTIDLSHGIYGPAADPHLRAFFSAGKRCTGTPDEPARRSCAAALGGLAAAVPPQGIAARSRARSPQREKARFGVGESGRFFLPLAVQVGRAELQ